MRRVINVSHAGFLLIGVVNTLLGPILPTLSLKWRLNDSQAGLLFFAQFTGALLGSSASGWLIKRLGLIPLMIMGYALLAVSVACLSVGQWLGGSFAIFALGVGLGFIIPATNLMIAELNPERPAGSLNLLNLVWGVGALLCPPLVSLFTRKGYFVGFLFGLAFLLALIARSLPRDLSISQTNNNARPVPETTSVLRSWMSPYALLTGPLIFIYVGTETAVGGWLASYTQRLGNLALHLWALTPSLFWTGLLLGRATAPVVLKSISERGLVLISLIVAAGGLSLILMSRELVVVSAGAFISGIGLAPVFPTTFAIFTRYFGASARNVAGVFFVLAALGGAIIPWIVGMTSSYYGELRIGLVVPLLGATAMIALQLGITSVLYRTKDVNFDK